MTKERAAFAAAQTEQQRKTTEAEATLAAERDRLAAQDAALATERAALLAQRQAAAKAEAALKAERTRLAQQAAEQDALLAAAEALGAGLIDLAQDAVTLSPAASDDPAAAQIVTRIAGSPQGWRRFVTALTPGWQRMRQTARQEAEAALKADRAQVASDRAEVESVWQALAAMLRHLLPDDGPVRSARDHVKRALARWRFTKDREPPRHPGQRDD